MGDIFRIFNTSSHQQIHVKDYKNIILNNIPLKLYTFTLVSLVIKMKYQF